MRALDCRSREAKKSKPKLPAHPLAKTIVACGLLLPFVIPSFIFVVGIRVIMLPYFDHLYFASVCGPTLITGLLTYVWVARKSAPAREVHGTSLVIVGMIAAISETALWCIGSFFYVCYHWHS
jgi:hypothetical protein